MKEKNLYESIYLKTLRLRVNWKNKKEEINDDLDFKVCMV